MVHEGKNPQAGGRESRMPLPHLGPVELLVLMELTKAPGFELPRRLLYDRIEAYGVDRNVARWAVRRLKKKKLLKNRRFKGTWSVKLTPQAIELLAKLCPGGR